MVLLVIYSQGIHAIAMMVMGSCEIWSNTDVHAKSLKLR
jgi:hypothetical protein